MELGECRKNLPNFSEIKVSRFFICSKDAHLGGVGYFSNELGFSVKFILGGISLNSSLWKRNDSSVVM